MKTAERKMNKGERVFVKVANPMNLTDDGRYTYDTVECEITRVFATAYEVQSVNGELVLPNRISRKPSAWWWPA
jgi:hypothetical protein